MKTIFTFFQIVFSFLFLFIFSFCQSPKQSPNPEILPATVEKKYHYSKQISEIKKQMAKTYLYPEELNKPKAFQKAAIIATESFGHQILLPKSFYTKFQDSIQGDIIHDGELSDLIIIRNPNFENTTMQSDSVASQLEEEFTKIPFSQDLLESVMKILYLQNEALSLTNTDTIKWEEIQFVASEGYVSSFLGSSLMIYEKYEDLLRPKTMISIEIPLKETKSKRKIITFLKETSFLKKIGLQNEDELITINGNPIRYLSTETVNRMFKGKVGENIDISILRNQNEKYGFKVPLKENKPSDQKIAEGQILTGKYNFIYIKVSGFIKNNQSSATEMMKENYFTLMEDAKNKNIVIHGFVLDLRNNPGGFLDQIIECMRMLIPNGLLVTTQSSRTSPSMVYANQSTITELPLVVLINENTGSGSELIAGVIQHYHRGIILGSKSTGQGLVHILNKVSGEENSLIKIASSFLYLPNGKKFHETGITPNVWVSDLKEMDLNLFDAKNNEQINSTSESKEKYQKLDITSISQWIEQNGTFRQKIRSDNDKNLLPDYQLYRSLDFFSGYLATQK
ncbi:peptidase S41 [Leptospira bourretii]|uniref:Peptidase S41 n=1 Tax=Leptospira bourretii TaxID=2484962 RepID=A0A4R9IQD3_9LEPT|nr:S41 family peptidase [Leptospira bourretii]TGK82850.1 peptidase S41 [Leptospira bourretii]TGK94197.1 peptidase S41 [Leptospira bourretii]TGL28031.1 peptidase S41 [Leptospira bourretii]